MVSELIESGYIFVLPEPDPQGRKVLFSVARKLDPERHNTSHVVRAHIATFEVRDRGGWGGVYTITLVSLNLSFISTKSGRHV